MEDVALKPVRKGFVESNSFFCSWKTFAFGKNEAYPWAQLLETDKVDAVTRLKIGGCADAS